MTIYELMNERIRARFSITPDGIQQEYFARRGSEWIVVVESFQPALEPSDGALPLYNIALEPQHRFLPASALRSVEKRSEQKIILKGPVLDGIGG